MNEARDDTGVEGIAIIGMSGRFPGAESTAAFWENLKNGVESVSFFTPEELALAGYPAAVLAQPGFVAARGVLDDVDLFDASFFGFSARDAEVMDPQQRLFLECAWSSLEDAGYDPAQTGEVVGVYAGSSLSSYMFQLYGSPEHAPYLDQMQVLILNDKDHLTTHASYRLNLTGPSVAVQTACSTSLVAVVAACDALWSGRCDLALAGGVTINLPQRSGQVHQPGGILSPDGHCRAFDAQARGTVGGNGVGLVVLRRLSDALAAGDEIRAVIRGAAINNDGSLKVGYTAPSVAGQAAVVASAHAMAGIDPATIRYVEAHGTGTRLGDPIELAALTEAFRLGTDQTGFCAIGSAKTNVGHLDTAAGVTGLIKAVLSLQHRVVPPSLHYTAPNPEIDFDHSPFYVSTRATDWPAGDTPRRAGVSSFGIGGTNAHLVLEEAPAPTPSGAARPEILITLSARTPAALDARTDALAAYLGAHPEVNLADVAHVTQIGRKAFIHRRTVRWPVHDVAGAAAALATRAPGAVKTNGGDARDQPVTFLFPGQGSQYVNMGRGLYDAEPAFRAAFDRCCGTLNPELGLDLKDLLYPAASTARAASVDLTRTALAQPALFAVEYAAACLWAAWGVGPQAMIGHSLGELVAACLAGVFSLDDALRVVAARGRLMEACEPGAMLVVALGEGEARAALEGGLSLAAVNAHSTCVLSGPQADVTALEQRLSARGVPVQRLATSHAFHSPMMEAAVPAFVDVMRGVLLSPPQLPFVSNVSGTWITPQEATDPEYWGRQLRGTVRFADGAQTLLHDTGGPCLEVGPGHTLGTLLRQQPGGADRTVLATLGGARDRPDDQSVLLDTLGQLWLQGTAVDWAGFSQHEHRRRLPLPTYPFERQRYWIGPPDRPLGGETDPRRPLGDWFYRPVWHRDDVPAPSGPTPVTSPWLVFRDEAGVGDTLVASLRERGQEAVMVDAGPAYSEAGGRFVVRRGHGEDLDQVFATLEAQGRLPARVVHLWLLTRGTEPGAEELLDRGFRSLLQLAQALGRRRLTQPLGVAVVSDGMQSVVADDRAGDEMVQPVKAVALGPCRVIPAEYPGVTVQSIDVDAFEPAGEISAQLLREFGAESAEPMVAYRDRQRFVQRFEAQRLEVDDRTSTAAGLRPGAVCLVTGGLGGIGLALAEHLARTVQARLVLVGRTAPPDRSAWADLLAHAPEDPVSAQIRAVQALEALGSEVLVVPADVADPAAMADVFAQTRARFGPLNGVIHSAGVAGAGMIQLKAPEVAAAVLAAKVQGTLVLDALLAGEELDFLVLCSSLASVYGGLGQVDYCGANAFLDSYAHSRARAGWPVVSVNWDTWKTVGMAVNTVVPPELQPAREASLARGIAPAEGAEVFSRILSSRSLGPASPQVAVCTTELLTGWAASGVPDDLTQDDFAAGASLRASHPRPPVSQAFVAPRTATEEAIAALWQDLLGVAPVGVHDDFFELGGHSLLAIQLTARLRDQLGIDVSLQELFDASTVAGLAEHTEIALESLADHAVIEQLLAQVEGLSDEEAWALSNGHRPLTASGGPGQEPAEGPIP